MTSGRPRAGRRPALAGSLVLAVSVGLLAVGAAATAHADSATYQNLLERVQGLLKTAERAANADDLAAAEEGARHALSLLQTADGLRPSDRDAPFLGVQAAVFARDIEAARLWLERFEQRNPQGERNPEIHYLRGMVALRLQGRADLALRSFERMFALNPGVLAPQRDVLYYMALEAEGARFVVAGDYEAAIRHFRAAALLGKRRGDLRRELAGEGNVGMAFQADKRYAEAEEVFADLARRDPDNPYWTWRLGVNLANQNRWEEAIPYYEEVVRQLEAGKGSPPQLPELRYVYLRLGNSYRNIAGKPETPPAKRAEMLEIATQRIARFQELVPTDARGHYWMGMLLYQEFERPYEALPHFRRSYELDPVCDHALRHMIQIYAVYGPAPLPGGGEAPAEVRSAWEAELARMRAENDANKDARAKERDNRENGPTRDAGCE